MSVDQLLSTHDIARRSGASYRQIDMWVRHGAIVPALWLNGSEVIHVGHSRTGLGTGTKRRFRPEAAAVARALLKLSEVNAPDTIKATLARALEANPDLWDGAVVVCPDETVHLWPPDREGGWTVSLPACRAYAEGGWEDDEDDTTDLVLP